MNLRPIIDEIASQADDFLDGVTSREQARAGIAELLTMDYSGLVAADRKIVSDAVMATLEDESFFNGGFAGHSFDDDSESTDDES
ncbi:hypothetical protein [Rariglobus hedericola]|uniref:Uncharacterized protein n=1 Tax=Rariglobus hedericola TaxID=2597822 RepID=A0A556QNF9_9BACT|nr:hypothetical protein [Rariglobus hedericola]TSJ78174.1 hypothetical protein FPL22_02380 [Rariglobus hedericola]